MNRGGHPQSLVAAHPGNLNAVRHGAHSPRLIQARAAEILAELTQAFPFSPAERLAAEEAARCIAILEAIDRDLDERGLSDRAGKPRYLLNYRARISRQLEHWLARLDEPLRRHQAAGQERPRAEFADYIRALQRIALTDPSASTAERLAALKELVKLGAHATSSYLDSPDPQPPGEPAAELLLRQRFRRLDRAKRAATLEKGEQELGLAD